VLFKMKLWHRRAIGDALRPFYLVVGIIKTRKTQEKPPVCSGLIFHAICCG
jgi:hypothetical protein